MEIIVPHLFRMDITKMCLDAIPDSNKIILIDISTTGEAKNYAENHKKHIQYVRGPGYPNQWCFSKMANEGSKRCEGEWFMIICNDILFNKGEIEKIEEQTKNCSQDIGIIKHLGWWGLFWGAFRKKCFDELNGFDEIFYPCGGEDQDFYLRLVKKGMKIKLISIDFMHIEGGHHCRIETPSEQLKKFVNKWGFAPEGSEWHDIVDKGVIK